MLHYGKANLGELGKPKPPHPVIAFDPCPWFEIITRAAKPAYALVAVVCDRRTKVPSRAPATVTDRRHKTKSISTKRILTPHFGPTREPQGRARATHDGSARRGVSCIPRPAWPRRRAAFLRSG